MGKLVVLTLLMAVIATIWRAGLIYRVGAWLESKSRNGEGHEQIVSEKRLTGRIVQVVLGAKQVQHGGVVTLPPVVTVSVADLDASRAREGTRGLARAATSTVIRQARRNNWRIPGAFRIDVVADEHTLMGRPLPARSTLPMMVVYSEDHIRTPLLDDLFRSAVGSSRATEPDTGLPDRTHLEPHLHDKPTRTDAYANTELVFLGPRPADGASTVELAGSTGVLTIGRKGCDIVFDCDLVSRKHAKLAAVGDRWVLTDSGSLNGTFINGVRTTEAALVHNDEVRLGQSGPRFVFSRLSRDLPTRGAQ